MLNNVFEESCFRFKRNICKFIRRWNEVNGLGFLKCWIWCSEKPCSENYKIRENKKTSLWPQLDYFTTSSKSIEWVSVTPSKKLRCRDQWGERLNDDLYQIYASLWTYIWERQTPASARIEMVYTKEGEIYVCLTLLTLIPLLSAWNSSDVQAIRKNGVLSSNYDRLVRPSKITNVSVALNLLTINYMVMYR